MSDGLARPEVRAVLERLHADARRDLWRFATKAPAMAARLLRGRGIETREDTGFLRDVYIAVSPAQGRLLHLVGRTLGARRVVEFGTSFGISTIYLAAAVRDVDGGVVIGTEIEPEKHRTAVANLAEAGLRDVADVRLGDAMETLRDVPAPVDLVLLDGAKDLYLPILHLLEPKLRPGAVVFADNIKLFRRTLAPYVEYVQSGRNGFVSATLPLGTGFEYSYFEGAPR